jgi:hypothetical protein
MFFETILMNSPLKSRVVNDSKRYVDFTRKERHPKILTKDDLENMKKSGKFFARKFNLAVDKDILDIIDQEIDKVRTHARATRGIGEKSFFACLKFKFH